MAKNAAINHLKNLDVTARAAASPSMPKSYITPTNYCDTTANGLTRCIIDYIRLTGGQAERISNTGRAVGSDKKTETQFGMLTKKSFKWIKGSGTKGTADISATIKGRSVKIEVKIGKDKQSLHQLEYQEQIEKSGGIYFLAKDFMTFYCWYNDYFNGKGFEDGL
jgi:hypothetical protein